MKSLRNFALITILALPGCSYPQAVSYNVSHSLGKSAPQSAPSIAHVKRKVGNPYRIANRQHEKIEDKWYYPLSSSEGYRQKGIASWYGKDFHNKKTANGETYNMYAYTAAHKTLPLPTYVRVTNLNNNKSIIVKVNDRGPFVGDREIDMSYAGAKALGFVEQGTAPVIVEAISAYGGDVNRSGIKFTNRQSPKAPVVRHTNNNVQPTPNHESFTNRVVNKNKNPSQNTNEQPVASLKGDYFIQLGAFSDLNNARNLYYKSKHINNIKIAPAQLNNKTIYRVIIDGLNNIEHAEQTLQTVQNDGFFNAIIRKN